MLGIETRPRRRGRRLLTTLAVLVVTAVACSVGLIVAAHRAVDRVARVPDVASVLDKPKASIENYLLVGSDSRAGADPGSPDFGGIGSATDVSGQRSDTIMLLRVDKRTDRASLLSIPRDLWVPIPGHGTSRINAAFTYGPAVLVQTVRSSLLMPVHHYVEIDFSGFKALVDAIGGVPVCFQFPTRDANTGLNVTEPGCPVLTGVEALAYARSRHYEELRDDGWKEDATSDLGRSKRQRDFVNRAIQGALDKVKTDPFATGTMVTAIGKAIRIDGDLDPLSAATRLRTAVGSGLASYALPVVGTTIKGNAVLLLGDGANSVLDYFRGATDAAPLAA